MISAERLRELREYYYALAVRPGGMGLAERARALNTSTALVELEAARARIAELERLLMGLSQEDRAALEAGAKALDGAGHLHWCGVYTSTGGDCSCEYYERLDHAATLRRLGGQTT